MRFEGEDLKRILLAQRAPVVIRSLANIEVATESGRVALNRMTRDQPYYGVGHKKRIRFICLVSGPPARTTRQPAQASTVPASDGLTWDQHADKAHSGQAGVMSRLSFRRGLRQL
jgi:hypothetical protein